MYKFVETMFHESLKKYTNKSNFEITGLLIKVIYIKYIAQLK